MPHYHLNSKQASQDFNLRVEVAPRGFHDVTPVDFKQHNGTWAPLAMGVECSFPGVPVQAHGLRYVQSSMGAAYGGTTFCVIGRNTHYEGIDSVKRSIVAVLNNSRTIPDATYAAPVGKDGGKTSKYQLWGRRHYKMLADNQLNYGQDYSDKRLAPFHRVWMFYRLGPDETRSHGFLCLGNWFVTSVDQQGEALHLRSIPRPAGAPAPDMTALALVACRIANQLGTPPPAIAAAWASPGPARGASAPALVASGEIARPAAVRAADDPNAAMNILAGIAGREERQQEADDAQFAIQLNAIAIADEAEADAADAANQYGSMHALMQGGDTDEEDDVEDPPEEEELEEGELREEPLVAAPVPRSDKGKERATERPRSPYAANRAGVRGAHAEDDDSDDETPLSRRPVAQEQGGKRPRTA